MNPLIVYEILQNRMSLNDVHDSTGWSLDDDGQLQMMRLRVSRKNNLLQVLHHNLQAEARIFLDGALALTILPEAKLVAMEVLFNRFDLMSALIRQDIERGGDWLVSSTQCRNIDCTTLLDHTHQIPTLRFRIGGRRYG